MKSSDFAQLLGVELVGEDGIVQRADDLWDCGPGGVIWLRTASPSALEIIRSSKPTVVLCTPETGPKLGVPYIPSDNPRLAFIRILNTWFMPKEEPGIHPTALIHPNAQIGPKVTIGAYAQIGAEVILGEETFVGSGVSIEGKTILGRRCRIKANAVIGAAGFGYERDKDGIPHHFPHIGSIEIGDDVWIGSCSTVERAGLGRTRILSGVKIDDLVQIGHNCLIGENTLVMANVVTCGGATVGKECWIAPNSVIKQKVCVGDRVTIGLGSVVLKDVADGDTVAGVPARRLK